MKVFRASIQHGFQELTPTESARREAGIFLLNGRPRLPDWSVPETYSLYPLEKNGDFWRWSWGGFVVAPKALRAVHHFLDPAGELLPLQFEGETYWLFNCTECINCVDRDSCKWLVHPVTQERCSVKKFAFFTNRITQSIFTVPELSCNGILVMEESGDPELEFKALVESEGLTGLVFEELWDSEAP